MLKAVDLGSLDHLIYLKDITCWRLIEARPKIIQLEIKRLKMYTRIYDMRTRLRLSQVELATLAGVSQSQLSKYEKGEVTRPSHAKLTRIAEALNCKVEDITDEVGPSVNAAFSSFTQTAGAVFIPLYTEKQSMNTLFSHGEGVVIRPEGTQQQIKKPSFLDYSEEAYAVQTYTEAMSPRYKPGDTLFVDPKLSAQPDDDVVLLFRSESNLVGMIREMRPSDSEADEINARDLQSGKTVKFNKSDLYGIHVIVGMKKHRG
tara:strand:+ start:1207 stop:1986 length:780 start_codon:yes stop_codon:yes gene_type:complete